MKMGCRHVVSKIFITIALRAVHDDFVAQFLAFYFFFERVLS